MGGARGGRVMDAPQIQYCKTIDGVRIAYASAGSGSPVVVASAPGSHIQLDWEGVPEMRLAARLSHLVWYDSRGSGLSDRTTADFTLDSMLRDLEAVGGAAALDRFALIAAGDAGPIGVAYAGQNQTRVTHLVLINAWVTTTNYQQGIAYQIEEALRTRSPEAWLEAMAPLIFPDSPDAARRWVAEAPKRIDTNAHIAAQKAMEGWNAEPYLSSIRGPTLIIYNPTGLRWIPPSVAQRVAASIPDCRLVFEDPRSPRMGPLIGEFILGRPVNWPPASSADAERTEAPSGTAVILFADIADSTALTERMGDATFRAKARKLDDALRTAIRERGGTPVEGKLLGDGVLAVFTSARDAIEAALACGKAGDEGGLPLHLGLHAGDVIREENNVYGGAVNIASRIAGLSAAGEVLVSETVRSLARTSAGVSFEDRGEQVLKGVGEAVRVWAVVAARETGDMRQETGGV